uniref:Gp42 n=2 Tax=Mycobacterium avium TaxID=1764 RepID=Q8GE85_MYCAV|nr:Gp42 [Mycobacterium avium subsp. hominissuis A5]
MCRPTLCWNADNVAMLMEFRDIRNRAALAKAINWPRTTVYRSFNEDWSGRVRMEVLVAMSVTFDVPIGWLVLDPQER